MIALLACNSLIATTTTVDKQPRRLSRCEQKKRVLDKSINIYNNSDYELTVIVNNERHKPTEIRIPSHGTMPILVLTYKKNVNITANVDGKLMKNNVRRRMNSENYWEVTITKTFAGGIRITKRERRPISFLCPLP
jgi:hypothetical protein